MSGDRAFKLHSGKTSEYGRYVKSLWEAPWREIEWRIFQLCLVRQRGAALAVAAGNYSERPAVAGEGVEVEGDFQVGRVGGLLPAVGMPAGITHIVVTVTTHVIEIFSQ